MMMLQVQHNAINKGKNTPSQFEMKQIVCLDDEKVLIVIKDTVTIIS